MVSLQIPPEVISTGRQLIVRFKTDDTINWKGFSAAFVLAARDAQPATPVTTLRRTGTGPSRSRAAAVDIITPRRPRTVDQSPAASTPRGISDTRRHSVRENDFCVRQFEKRNKSRISTVKTQKDARTISETINPVR